MFKRKYLNYLSQQNNMEFLFILASVANIVCIIAIVIIDRQTRHLEAERRVIVFRLMILNRMMKTESAEILHAYESLLEEIEKLK